MDFRIIREDDKEAYTTDYWGDLNMNLCFPSFLEWEDYCLKILILPSLLLFFTLVRHVFKMGQWR